MTLHYSPCNDESPPEASSERKRVALSRPTYPKSSSAVRFRLPLTPPQQTDMHPKYKEVSTQDAAPEVFKLRHKASRWRKGDLQLLGVKYQYDKFDEIKIPVDGMPQDLLARTPLFNVI
jgi:hypothetical protein